MTVTMPNLAAFQAVPLRQKISLLALFVIGVGVLFYYYVENPQQDVLSQLRTDIAKLDLDIQTNRAKVQRLEELKKLHAELELQLVKNQAQLPPEEEAVMLLKQLSDVGQRVGLNLKLWKPGPRVEDTSKLFVRLPVSVEMSGGYHTLAIFFDRISKLPRIINVSKIKMGGGRAEPSVVSVQTSFELTAFAAPAGMAIAAAGK